MSSLDEAIDFYISSFIDFKEGQKEVDKARTELDQLREKAAKWDKLQADIEVGVIVLEMPADESFSA